MKKSILSILVISLIGFLLGYFWYENINQEAKHTKAPQANPQKAIDSLEIVRLGSDPHLIGIKIINVLGIPGIRKIGLRDNDIILGISGVPFKNDDATIKLFSKFMERQDFTMQIRRSGKETDLYIKF